VLALLIKTATVTLPPALLVVFWWQRGTLSMKRDIWPLVPFFALGAAAGLTTSWVEQKYYVSVGTTFELSLVERFLLAGRAIWFYVGKLIWPTNLIFFYPRWSIDAGQPSQWIYSLAVLAVTAALWAARKRSRGPLAGWLYFCGTLLPVLGFFNVYYFTYSFVADHFQYLASLGIVAGLAAGLMRLLERRRWRINAAVVAVVVAAPLGVLTFQYSHQYADAETLYRETIAGNPASTLARGNLAARLFDGPPAGWAEATEHARAILAVDPDNVAGHNLLGLGLQREGRLEESLRELDRAVALDPGLAEAHFNRGLTLDGLGRLDEARASYERSLSIYPQNVKALHNLANVLRRLGRFDDALARVRAAIAIDPDNADVRLNLADTLQAKGDRAAAIAAYQEALGRRPDWGAAWNNLGLALGGSGRLDEARQAFERAAQLLPQSPLVHTNLGNVLMQLGRVADAQREFTIAKTLR